MNQQINLLQPMFRKGITLFSAEVVLRISAIVAVALGLVYGAAAWRAGAAEREHARLLEQRDAAQRRLTEVSAQFSARPKSQMLEAELASLNAARENRAGVLRVLADGGAGSTQGFSPLLAGLARQRIDGLWLTRLEVAAGGRELVLQGIALDERLLPRYIEGLGRDAALATRAFEVADLDRTAGGANFVFELRTRAKGAAAGAAP